MPRLFSRLPVSLHSTAVKALVGLAVLCALIAILSFIGFSETTESTGHLWWKETREIPYGDRRPYLLAGVGFAVAAASLLIGTMELVAAQARQRRSDRRRLQEAAEAQRRWEISPEGQAHRQAEETAAQRRREAKAAQRAEREAAEARLRWERSTAGRAAAAHQRGDHYFSIELVADEHLAQHLNAVTTVGWVQDSVSRRHTKTTSVQPMYDGTHEVTRDTIEYRTYLFRRDH